MPEQIKPITNKKGRKTLSVDKLKADRFAKQRRYYALRRTKVELLMKAVESMAG